MVRAARLGRYVAATLVVGCGAAPLPVVVQPSPPALSAVENQQGHPLETERDDDEPDAVIPPAQPSIPGVYLWCHSPTGRACLLAASALGTDPKDARGLPPSLQTVEDRSDDCSEPTIHTIESRLSAVLGVQPTGWRDQGGTYLDMTSLDELYSAAGCINDAEPDRPIAKIHAADGVSPRTYLVRVFEHQEAERY